MRRKLEKKLSEEKKLFTEEALKKASYSMRMWITRHAGKRISLKDKDIKLFDNNKHTAKISSRYINKLRKQISMIN
ncbi:MAG: hypothetical protein HN411_04100 [Waddliaceae bacterium]|jgi:hypothetical protein|nr:hypothetical protein [Waddliaceae bacterium]MBT3578787.1 hypothetical protein [Waddliaceae bacterium]MBT4444459.1 hypothetical protein [Waddliaceae bacterium]MBT6928610.1 hypothetical protein [Waddliaceae bacterium]MBT7265126.1 hypothetical protein [Waddliaceae bacterium]